MRSDISVSKYNLFISFVSSILSLIETIFFSFNLKVPLYKGKLINFTKFQRRFEIELIHSYS